LALINDFLDIAKIESGRFELDLVATPVQDLCQASVRIVHELASRKEIRCTLQVDPQVFLVRADERRLRQALINLLSNAIKFTPHGGTIGLDVQGDPEAGVVRLTVWDTGIGIAADDIPRLFQPFAQITGEYQRQNTGSGLGLALVAQLIELHGGGVALTSEVGRGSRFTLALPWSSEEQDRLMPYVGQTAPDYVPSDAEYEGLPALAPGLPHVLVVEDDQATAAVLCDYLGRCGYRVARAESGEEALALVREDVPALVLMDVRMRGIDGLETIQVLRANVATRHIPILALTALAMPGDRERCLAAGANSYMSKPVRLRRLAEAIAALVEPARG
jgi:CheY-like chemotaxis protein